MTDEQTPAAGASLLPCPFCGGEAWLNDYEAKYSDLPPQSRAPQCRSCGASMGYLTTPAKAIAAWNRRPHLPSPPSSSSVVRGDASGSERGYSDAEILEDTVPADLLDDEIVAFGLRMEGSSTLYPSIRNTEEGAYKLADCLAEKVPENPRYVPVALSLRPQPSGETREGDDKLFHDSYIAMRDAMRLIDADEGPGRVHSNALQALADCRVRIENRTTALLSTRPAPVASGGQPEQGGGMEVVAWRYRTAAHRAWHFLHDAEQAKFEREDGSEIQALIPAEPAEARVRSLTEALEQIADMRPATCETGLAHDMAQIATETLAALQQAGEVE